MRATCFKITTARSPDAGAQRRNPGRYYFPALRFALCGLLADSALLSLDQRRRPRGRRRSFLPRAGLRPDRPDAFLSAARPQPAVKKPFAQHGCRREAPESGEALTNPDCAVHTLT